MNKSIVGDIINYRGMLYAPINEAGVVILFAKMSEDLNLRIEEMNTGYPDCIARRRVGDGWEKISIEFEYKSKNFYLHQHDPSKCDLIVCWENNWKESPIEVLELKSEIKNISYSMNQLLPADNDQRIINHFKTSNSSREFYEIYVTMKNKLQEINENIWAKPSEKYIGIYSPHKMFASLRINKKTMQISCFCRNKPIRGTKIINDKFCPRWCSFIINNCNQLDRTIKILVESYHLHSSAIAAGEKTGYISPI